MFRLLIFLFAFSGYVSGSFAGWTHVASTLNDDAIFYVLDESVEITGKDTRIALEIVNHPYNTRQGYKSIMARQEYDCKSKRVRTMYVSAHSELFGKGKTLKIAEGLPLPWQVMPEGSVATHTRDYICSK